MRQATRQNADVRSLAGATRQQRSAGIWLAIANCFVALPALLLRESDDVVRLLATVSLVLFVALLLRRLNNVFFLARTLFLGGIGYYPMLVKVLAGSDALFSFYEKSTQGFDIVTVMYVGTSLALLGNEIGLFIGGRVRVQAKAHDAERETAFWRTTFYAAIPVVVLVSVLVIQSAPTVLVAAYGSTVSETRLLGNTQNIGIICLLAMFVALHKANIRHGRAIHVFLAVLFLVWALFLRGLRQDVVTALLGLAVCHGLVYRREFRISLKNVGVFIAVVVVVELMGVARNTLATEGLTATETWALFASNIIGSDGTYHSGTISPIATTFANVVHLIDTHTMSPLFGRSFLEFIPRTPPAFIYPNRPRDYAWMFPDYGLSAGGGIFELAEAYMNFGMVGVLVIPAVISFFMARAFYNTLQKQSVLSYFLLFTFLGMFLRGTWYQIFAFYKSFWTAIILLAAFAMAHAVFGQPSRSGVLAPRVGRLGNSS